jgi:GNAT superfamily N-acetyltransferase
MKAASGGATPERLQEHMRAVARQQYDRVSVPPFALYFHPTDALPYLNYAIPEEAPGDAAALAAPLARLRAEFGIRRRRPRFEFVEAAFPALGPALEASGFVREARPQLMICRAEDLRAVAPIPGLAVDTLDALASLDDFRALLRVQRRAFGLPDPEAVSEQDARWLRDGLGAGLAFMGRLGGAPVSTSMFLDPRDGLTELVGICTLEAHRRRGLGGALTHAALVAAFARGVTVAFLSAADARAGRVYEAAGFTPFGSVLFVLAKEESAPDIREAVGPELAAARALVLEHADDFHGPGAARVKADAETLPGPYAAPDGCLLVARSAEEPAGCVAYERLDPETCEVKRVFVRPALRGNGLARALMIELLARARTHGYRRARLETLEGMMAARALCRDLGFTEIPGERPGEHVDTIVFERTLR